MADVKKIASHISEAKSDERQSGRNIDKQPMNINGA